MLTPQNVRSMVQYGQIQSSSKHAKPLTSAHTQGISFATVSAVCKFLYIRWFSRRQNAPRVPEQVLIMAFCSYGGSRGSSVSIVSGYGLDDRTTGRSGFVPRQGQRIFPLSSVSRPALRPTQSPVQWVPAVLSPGQSAAGAWRWPLTPHLVPRSRMSRSYISSPPQAPPWRVAGLFCFAHMGNGCSGVHTAYSRGQATTHFRKQACLIVVQHFSPWVKNNFPVWPRGQRSPINTIFEN
jgi:hypothetical protein